MEEKSALGRGRAGRHHGTGRAPATEFVGPHPIRLILVPVDETRECRVRLDVAAHLAKATQADLAGVGLERTAGPEPAAADKLRSTAPANISAPHRTFDAKMANAGVDCYWREIRTDGIDQVIAWAKLADLTVVSQLAEDTPRPFQADRIGLECGRPILVVPPTLPTETIGLNVVIAWDGSREVVRALHDAMPLMRDAANITIVEYEADLAGHRPNRQAAQAVLERHGFQAFSEVHTSSERSVTDHLLERVGKRQADLLVAGLYHHSRLREYILGGVSRELLRRCPIALLVSH